jgi:hypothetical protein
MPPSRPMTSSGDTPCRRTCPGRARAADVLDGLLEAIQPRRARGDGRRGRTILRITTPHRELGALVGFDHEWGAHPRNAGSPRQEARHRDVRRQRPAQPCHAGDGRTEAGWTLLFSSS